MGLVTWEQSHSQTPTPLHCATKPLAQELLEHLYLSRAAPIGQNAASLWRLVNQQKGRRDLGPSLSDLFL